MLSLLLILAGVTGSLATDTGHGCPHGFKYYPDRDACYFMSPIKETYADAEVTCQSFNARLAKVDTVALRDWVTKYMGLSISMPLFWVGLRDSPEDPGVFSWPDGTIYPPTGALWYKGQPTGENPGNDCIRMECYEEEYLFGDSSCDEGFIALCEIPPMISELSCPDGFVGNEATGLCYYFSPTHQSYEAAEATCESLNAKLAKVDSSSVRDWLQVFVLPSDRPEAWAGLRDSDSEPDVFRWPDGTQYPLAPAGTLWNVNEPNGNRPGDNCVRLKCSSSEYELWDSPCTYEYAAICEITPGDCCCRAVASASADAVAEALSVASATAEARAMASAIAEATAQAWYQVGAYAEANAKATASARAEAIANAEALAQSRALAQAIAEFFSLDEPLGNASAAGAVRAEALSAVTVLSTAESASNSSFDAFVELNNTAFQFALAQDVAAAESKSAALIMAYDTTTASDKSYKSATASASAQSTASYCPN